VGQQALAQIQYTSHFTRKLQKCNAEFISPVEGFYKIKLLKKGKDTTYDLALESNEHELELRYRLESNFRSAAPHVVFTTNASTLASNDEHFDLKLHVFDPEEAQSIFNAEWAAYADFVPKSSVTNKFYGRLVTLYRENMLLETVLFYNKQDDEKDRRMYSLLFMPFNDAN
jgi:hypothetical protein